MFVPKLHIYCLEIDFRHCLGQVCQTKNNKFIQRKSKFGEENRKDSQSLCNNYKCAVFASSEILNDVLFME